MSPPLKSLHALTLSAVDFLTAGLLYHFVTPSMGVLVGLVGFLLLCSIVYQFVLIDHRRGPS